MTDNKKKEELREKIRKCLIPADYHTELHENIPVKSWTYTREGIDFHVDQILALCESIRAEALKDLIEEEYGNDLITSIDYYNIGKLVLAKLSKEDLAPSK